MIAKSIFTGLLYLVFLVSGSFVVSSCGEDGGAGESMGCPGGINVIARDFRNFQECGFVLERSDGSFLVIVNFNEFSVPIQDGAEYVVLIEQLLNAEAPCMNGVISLLLCIERK